MNDDDLHHWSSYRVREDPPPQLPDTSDRPSEFNTYPWYTPASELGQQPIIHNNLGTFKNLGTFEQNDPRGTASWSSPDHSLMEHDLELDNTIQSTVAYDFPRGSFQNDSRSFPELMADTSSFSHQQDALWQPGLRSVDPGMENKYYLQAGDMDLHADCAQLALKQTLRQIEQGEIIRTSSEKFGQLFDQSGPPQGLVQNIQQSLVQDCEHNSDQIIQQNLFQTHAYNLNQTLPRNFEQNYRQPSTERRPTSKCISYSGRMNDRSSNTTSLPSSKRPNRSRYKPKLRFGSKRNIQTYQSLDPKNIHYPGLLSSQAELGKLYLQLGCANSDVVSLEACDKPRPKEPKSQDICIHCKIGKRKCDGAAKEGGCSECQQRKKYCVGTNLLLLILSPPELYIELRSDPFSSSNVTSESIKIYQANIFASFSSDELGAPLPCKVYETGLEYEDPSRNYMIWENLRGGANTEKHLIQKRRLESCLIPSRNMPSPKDLIRWALDSVQKLPSGVVGCFYGVLYSFAADYIKVLGRPLNDVVVLALIHIAIYNICHGKMWIIFDQRQRTRIPLPPRLRAQVCASLFPIFEVTGAKLQQAIKKNLHKFPKHGLLAYSIVNWLLMLTYEHCLNQTANAASLQLNEIGFHIPDLSGRERYLNGLVTNLRDLHKAIFKGESEHTHIIFQSARKIGDKGYDLDNALARLREAIEGQDPPVEKMALVDILAPLWESGVGFKNYPQPPQPSESTLPTIEKLDFDKMTIATLPSHGDGATLPSHGDGATLPSHEDGNPQLPMEQAIDELILNAGGANSRQ